MNTALLSFLSFLPILVLLVISLWKGVKPGIYAGFVLTTALFFLMQGEGPVFVASIFSALVGTINIMMIIFGAVFLYHVMEQKGFIGEITGSLTGIHPSRSFLFFFLAIFLTAFFENVAGFGTPGAIVPLLLISIGFGAVTSISAVLLINGLFALTGAVGTAMIAGLQTPLSLDAELVRTVFTLSTLIMLVPGLVIILFINRLLVKHEGVKPGKYGWLLYVIIMVPYVVACYYLQELAGIVVSLFLAVVAYFFLFRHRQISFRPWLPYGVLVLLLLLPKLFPPLADLLAYTWHFDRIMGTDVSSSFQPLRSPLTPFLLASVVALYQRKDFRIDVRPVVQKSFAVFMILFPSIAITQLMLNGGGDGPSMIALITGVAAQAGKGYLGLSPFIGVLGAFISGSTTVSNIIFGSVQYSTAQVLDFPTALVLSLQHMGASLGNAVCLFNIIAAAAVAGVSQYKKILQNNLLPVLLISVAGGAIGYGIWLVF